MKRLAYILLTICVATSCTVFQRENRQDVAVQVGNAVLTRQQLAEVTQAATTPDDSAALAEAYIRQWAGHVLFAEKATRNRDEAIERRVDEYRRELYLHKYEERLVTSKMNQEVAADSILAFYTEHSDMFVLDGNIVKGLLLVVPNGAPDMKKLRKWMQQPLENIEPIEKYAYQYATGYELFTDTWMSDHTLLRRIPLESSAFAEQLKKHDQIEVTDSLHTYLLQVTDKYMTGEAMPIDVASTEIKKILLAERVETFLEEQRNTLYEDAKMTLRVHVNE